MHKLIILFENEKCKSFCKTSFSTGAEITDYIKEFDFASEKEMLDFTNEIIKQLQWGSYKIFTFPYKNSENYLN